MKNLPKYINRSQAKKLTGLSYLGSVNSSAKIEKGKKLNVDTFILYLAPANLSGYNVCPGATIECINLCLNGSGRVILDKAGTITKARILKTKLFFENRAFFMAWLIDEIAAARINAINNGREFSVRLNGTSDISPISFNLDGKNILEYFPQVQFYDYTKVLNRFEKVKYSNYHLTFSYSGENWIECEKVLQDGNNVAAVFLDSIPSTYAGYKVINGDETDLRYKDEKGVIVGLKYKRTKGNSKPVNSKFVINNHLQEFKQVKDYQYQFSSAELWEREQEFFQRSIITGAINETQFFN